MSNQQWKAKWRRNDTGFHQDEVNQLLQRFWPQLSLPEKAVILVPLCGKSLDLGWLTSQGHRVIGIELSDIAVQAYFRALHVVPKQQRHGRFVKWRHGDTEIWRGDIFDLTQADLFEVGAIYDCAALTALPAETRIRYVRHLGEMAPDDCEILLMTTESPDDTQADSAQEIDEEVSALYRSRYEVTLLHGEACCKRDPECPEAPKAMFDEKVYHMRPRAGVAAA